MQDIAFQIASHLTRLQRFCERVRDQGGASLQSIYIFGHRGECESLAEALRKNHARIQVGRLDLPSALHSPDESETPEVVRLALWAANQWTVERNDCLPPPDLLFRLQQLQQKPLLERVVRNFYPSAIAAALILCVAGLYVHDYRHLAIKRSEVANMAADVSITENELATWESKTRMIEGYQELERQLTESSWSELIAGLAPCLPRTLDWIPSWSTTPIRSPCGEQWWPAIRPTKCYRPSSGYRMYKKSHSNRSTRLEIARKINSSSN